MGTFANMKNKITKKAREFKEKVKSSSFSEKMSSLKNKFLETKVGQFVSNKLSFFKSKQREASEFALTDEQKAKLYGKSDLDVPQLYELLEGQDESTKQIAGTAYVSLAMKSASKSYDKIGYDSPYVIGTIKSLVDYHNQVTSLDKNSDSFNDSIKELKEIYGKDVVNLYNNTVSSIEKYNNNKSNLLAKGVSEKSTEYGEFLEKNYKLAYGIGDMSVQDFHSILASKKLACIGLSEEQYEGKAAIDVDAIVPDSPASEQLSDPTTDKKTPTADKETPTAVLDKETTAEAESEQEKTIFNRPSKEVVAGTVAAFDTLRKWTEEHATVGEDGVTSYDIPIGSSEEYMNAVHAVGSMMKNAGIECNAYDLTDVCLSKSKEEIEKYFDTAFDIEESFSEIIDHAQAARNYKGGFNTDRAIVESLVEQNISKIKEIYPDAYKAVEGAANSLTEFNGRSVNNITNMVIGKGGDEAGEYLRKALGFYTVDKDGFQANDPLKKVKVYNEDFGFELTEEQIQKVCELTKKAQNIDLSIHGTICDSCKDYVDGFNFVAGATKKDLEAVWKERQEYLSEIFGDTDIIIQDEEGNDMIASLPVLAESMIENNVDLNLDDLEEYAGTDPLTEYIQGKFDESGIRDLVDKCMDATMESCEDYMEKFKAGEFNKYISDDVKAEIKAEANRYGEMAVNEFGDLMPEENSDEDQLTNP